MAIQHYRNGDPTDLPVSVGAAKDDLELIGHSHDSKITRRIGSARGIWERYTSRAAVVQSWVMIVESESAIEQHASLVGTAGGNSAATESRTACRSTIELPIMPFIEITKVESRDNVDDEYAVADEDDYFVDGEADQGRLVWAKGKTIPPFRKITYSAGYLPGALPAEYQETLFKLIVFLFMNRGDVESSMPKSLMAEMKGQATGTSVGYWG